jgi:hypothetical protein
VPAPHALAFSSWGEPVVGLARERREDAAAHAERAREIDPDA